MTGNLPRKSRAVIGSVTVFGTFWDTHTYTHKDTPSLQSHSVFNRHVSAFLIGRLSAPCDQKSARSRLLKLLYVRNTREVPNAVTGWLYERSK